MVAVGKSYLIVSANRGKSLRLSQKNFTLRLGKKGTWFAVEGKRRIAWGRKQHVVY